MKTIKNYCATFTLILTLSGLAYAGQIDAPPVVGPTPPPPGASTQVEDPTFEDTFSIILSILSIF